MQSLRVKTTILRHDHEYYELCIVRRGTASHHCNAGVQKLCPGDVVVMAPGNVHAFGCVEGLEVLNVYYLGEWLLGQVEDLRREGIASLFLASHLFGPHLTPEPAVFPLAPSELSMCLQELADIDAEASRPKASLLLLRCALIKLLCRLGRAHARSFPCAPGFHFDPRVQKMLDGIEAAAHAGRPLDLPSLAASIFVTPNHAARLLRSAIGASPTAYYQRRRVQRASLLLLDKDVSVTQVAQRLGYADHCHLTRCFREHMGLSPRAYRRVYFEDQRTCSSEAIPVRGGSASR